MPFPPDLLTRLRCPACAPEPGDRGKLDLINAVWLVCQTCDRKYPIRDDIPIMLITEGDRWQSTAIAALPAEPPEPAV